MKSTRRRGSAEGGRLYRLWIRDDERCAEAIAGGRDIEVVPSAYGQNDFLIQFLMASGLWAVLVGMYPDLLRKHNGKPWRALNGVEVVRELAEVEHLGHCGKVLADVRLMMIAGFNAEEVVRACRRGRPVVDPETLANHLNRISPASCTGAFLEQLKLLRRRRWIRACTWGGCGPGRNGTCCGPGG